MKVRETEISKVSRDSTRAPSASMNHDAKNPSIKQKALSARLPSQTLEVTNINSENSQDEPLYLQRLIEAKTSALLAARLHATSPFGELFSFPMRCSFLLILVKMQSKSRIIIRQCHFDSCMRSSESQVSAN